MLPNTELSYGMNFPKGYHGSDEEHTREKPAWINQGQTMLDKHDHLLGQITCSTDVGQCLPGFPQGFQYRNHNPRVKHRLGSTWLGSSSVGRDPGALVDKQLGMVKSGLCSRETQQDAGLH